MLLQLELPNKRKSRGLIGAEESNQGRHCPIVLQHDANTAKRFSPMSFMLRCLPQHTPGVSHLATGGRSAIQASIERLLLAEQEGAISAPLPESAAIVDHAVGDKRVAARGLPNVDKALSGSRSVGGQNAVDLPPAQGGNTLGAVRRSAGAWHGVGSQSTAGGRPVLTRWTGALRN